MYLPKRFLTRRKWYRNRMNSGPSEKFFANFLCPWVIIEQPCVPAMSVGHCTHNASLGHCWLTLCSNNGTTAPTVAHKWRLVKRTAYLLREIRQTDLVRPIRCSALRLGREEYPKTTQHTKNVHRTKYLYAYTVSKCFLKYVLKINLGLQAKSRKKLSSFNFLRWVRYHVLRAVKMSILFFWV